MEEVFFCRDQSKVEGRSGDIVSLIPWNGAVKGISTNGLRWPLNNETLYPDKDTRHQQRNVGALLPKSVLKLDCFSSYIVVCRKENHETLFDSLARLNDPVGFVRAKSHPAPQSLTVMTHNSFAVSDNVIQAFEQANNVKVTFVKGGDAGEMLNKAILSKDAPLADVLYGVDNTLLSEALDADIYQPYASPALKNIPAEFQLNSSDRALPVDHGYVCVVYDKAYFSAHNLSAPQSLEDLTKPEYKGLLVMENPATSSPGLDFLFATIKHFGDSNYLDYWKQLRANGLVVVDGWETAYYTNFSGSSGQGAQALVVSYATDPAYEVMSASTPIADAPVAAVVGPDTCFHQIEFVGILKGTQATCPRPKIR